jgi:hypothetical protein
MQGNANEHLEAVAYFLLKYRTCGASSTEIEQQFPQWISHCQIIDREKTATACEESTCIVTYGIQVFYQVSMTEFGYMNTDCN